MTKAKSPWQPIETAPKDGTDVLVTDGSGYFEVAGLWGVREYAVPYWRGYYGAIDTTPTHWMPIPPLPEEK